MGRWNGNAGFGQAAFGPIRARRFDDVRSSSLHQQRAGVLRSKRHRHQSFRLLSLRSPYLLVLHMLTYTPQGRCTGSMLHCNTALLFSMHPAEHGMAAGLTAITQLSVRLCVCLTVDCGSKRELRVDAE